MQNLWDACLRRLEQELPAQQFNTWIRPLSPDTGAPSDTLTLTAPNRFVLASSRAVYGEGAWTDSQGNVSYPGQRSAAMLEIFDVMLQ